MEHSLGFVNVRHIVQELQKENLTAAHRITLLESENQLLTAEADQLRQVTNHRLSSTLII